MKIRELTWKGLQMWPPEWFISEQGTGDDGILEDVKIYDDLSPILLRIEVDYQGDARKGVILLEDPGFLEPVFSRLKENIGRPLSEIGNLEVKRSSLPQRYGMKPVRPRSPNLPSVRKKVKKI